MLQRTYVPLLILLILTVAVYAQVLSHEFLSYDDHLFVTENSRVQAGLSLQGTVWAFTTGHAQNWVPLTWLSHMADVELFGLNPRGHHLMNLLLHLINSILVFLVFKGLTGQQWRSFAIAALFAVHPLHVESVAWVSERRDVLSTLFWLLTMGAYGRYARNPSGLKYAFVLVFFALGLLAKPMLVTLPFVLLLLDYWPLGRMGRENGGIRWTRLVLEKVPLLVLAGCSSVVTFIAQSAGGAVAPMGELPFALRLSNAAVAYPTYLWKTLWPANLAVFYPFRAIPLLSLQVAASVLFLLAVSCAVVKSLRRRPYLAVGWFWYLGTLLPVIGLVQVGVQSMADRYTYVTLLGIFMIVCWGVPELLERWRPPPAVLPALTGVALIAFSAVAWRQGSHWRNDFTLFGHALAVTSQNTIAHMNLGKAFSRSGNYEQAKEHFLEAAGISPEYAAAQQNLGVNYARLGQYGSAVIHLSRALRLDPDNVVANFNMGTVLFRQGRLEEAATYYLETLRVKPDHTGALINLGSIYSQRGEMSKAEDQYRRALSVDPGLARAHYNLGNIYLRQGRTEEAAVEYRKALQIKPDMEKARANLNWALSLSGKRER